MVGFDGEKVRNPWRYPLMGTLTGFSKWFVRRCSADGTLCARLLRGCEHMKAMGWSLEDYLNVEELMEGPAGSEDTLKSLAGNAFSGYALGPVLSACMACYGVPTDELDIQEDDLPADQSEDDSQDFSD